MRARLGYALALAAAPVRVADELMDRLAVQVHGDDLLREFLGEDAPHPEEPVGVPRFAPRNLTFADGLTSWEFGGSFRDPDPDAADYTSGLHLLGGMPTGPVSLEKSLTMPLSGSNGWTVLELSATVAEHGGMVQFGSYLRGPGRVEFRNPQLTSAPAARG
jgi:hypothetical protein